MPGACEGTSEIPKSAARASMDCEMSGEFCVRIVIRTSGRRARKGDSNCGSTRMPKAGKAATEISPRSVLRMARAIFSIRSTPVMNLSLIHI